jgi:fumarate reductase flavoprotein subunit
MVSYEWEHFTGTTFLTVLVRRAITIWVNRKGQRFTDEGIPIMVEAANAIYRQPGKYMFCLWDSQTYKKMLTDPLTPFEAFFIGSEDKANAGAPFAEKVERDLQSLIAAGTAKVAGSLDEIARWIETAPASLRTTIAEYNSFCAKGHDDVYAKNYASLKPLTTPPYYALKCNIGLTATHGGIKINERAEALDKNDDPIPGLYAAGNETGATDGDSYNMWLSGHAFGFAVNTGRIAGEEVARYISKK